MTQCIALFAVAEGCFYSLSDDLSCFSIEKVVLFSESLTEGYKTENGNDMISKLQSLVASGGGDCPEFAMSGLKKGTYLCLYDNHKNRLSEQ